MLDGFSDLFAEWEERAGKRKKKQRRLQRERDKSEKHPKTIYEKKTEREKRKSIYRGKNGRQR